MIWLYLYLAFGSGLTVGLLIEFIKGSFFHGRSRWYYCLAFVIWLAMWPLILISEVHDAFQKGK